MQTDPPARIELSNQVSQVTVWYIVWYRNLLFRMLFMIFTKNT